MTFHEDHSTDDMISSLNPEIQEKLDILTRVAELLGLDDVSFLSYASAITRLSSRASQTQQSLNRLQLVENELQDHLMTMRHEEQLFERGVDRLAAELATGESTPTLQHQREVLLKKAKEYRAMLDSIVIEHPPVTFVDLTALQTANAQRAHAIKAKRAQLRAFKGLPPNLELARQQLKNARAAQMKLIQLREQLLGQMAASVV